MGLGGQQCRGAGFYLVALSFASGVSAPRSQPGCVGVLRLAACCAVGGPAWVRRLFCSKGLAGAQGEQRGCGVGTSSRQKEPWRRPKPQTRARSLAECRASCAPCEKMPVDMTVCHSLGSVDLLAQAGGARTLGCQPDRHRPVPAVLQCLPTSPCTVLGMDEFSHNPLGQNGALCSLSDAHGGCSPKDAMGLSGTGLRHRSFPSQGPICAQ